MKTKQLSVLIAKRGVERLIFLPDSMSYSAILSAIRTLHPGYRFVESWEAV